MTHRRTTALVFGMLLVVAPALAGRQPPASMRLAEVKANGLQRYTLNDVLMASGLAIDSRVGIGDIEAAADRLGKSGLVERVEYQYSYQGDVLSVTFDLVEAAAEEEVVFDNLAWFSDAELAAEIARDLPGFKGKVTGLSVALDHIERRLERLLKDRGIPSSVSYSHYLDASTGRSAHLFKADLSVPICRVTLDGASATFRAALSREADDLLGRGYSRISVASFARATFVPIYRQRGYLRARIDGALASVAEGLKGCNGADVSVMLNEGLQYSWQGSTWTGNRVLGASELDRLLGVGLGDIADGIKLDEGLVAVARAYRRKGHVAVRTDVAPEYSDQSRSVRYGVAVDEGPQYRMGSLSIVASSDGLSRRLAERWKLTPGTVFDAEYAAEFFKTVRETEPQLLQGVKGYDVGFAPHPQALVVDVKIALQY